MTVAKLSGARDPKRALTGRWEGPPPIAEQLTEVVALAKELRHYPINKRKRSLRGTTTVAEVDVPKLARMLPYK